MKKSTPWATAQAEYETRIRQDEREKMLTQFSKAMAECYEFASKIMQRTAAFRPAVASSHTGIVGDPIVPQAPSKKRKATTANQEQIDEALRCLRNIRPPSEPLTPKQIARMWDQETFGGLKSAGAALRVLVEQGLAVEVKRGKFKVVGTGANSEAHDDAR